MEPIDNVRRSLDLLRRQLAENVAKAREAASPNPYATAQANPRSSSLAGTARQAAIRKIKSLSPDDPRYEDKAINAFVESVLSKELGESLVNNPEFQEMVREVQRLMTSDSELAAELRELTRALASEP